MFSCIYSKMFYMEHCLHFPLFLEVTVESTFKRSFCWCCLSVCCFNCLSPLVLHSEIRLVEIVEGLCESSSFECNRMVEEHEDHFETWWFKRSVLLKMQWDVISVTVELKLLKQYQERKCRVLQEWLHKAQHTMHLSTYACLFCFLLQCRKTKNPDLHKWFCIETIKVCCPKGTFGPDCNGE